VRDLLAAPQTAFVLVTSPRPDAIDEASYFASKLTEAEIGVDALVVNRLHPRFGGPDEQAAANVTDSPLAVLRSNLAEFQRVAAGEEAHFEKLAAQVAPAAVQRVPFLAGDVHDLEGLELVGTHLVGNDPEPPPTGDGNRPPP
jgi:anion-transporting  ArsA/GET3 family ATPase